MEGRAAGLDANAFRFGGSFGTAREPAAPGLVRMGFRYYDADAGRFITRDPIGLLGGDVNRYSYVGNKPTTFTDPAGLSPNLTPSDWTTILTAGGDIFWTAGSYVLSSGSNPLLTAVSLLADRLAVANAFSSSKFKTPIGVGLGSVGLAAAWAASAPVSVALSGYGLSYTVWADVVKVQDWRIPILDLGGGKPQIRTDPDVRLGTVFGDFFSGKLVVDFR